jgi:hypothetical protein
MALSGDAQKEFDATVKTLKAKAPPAEFESDVGRPTTSILISSADRRVIVMDSGRIVAQGKASITNPGVPLGSHVFILAYLDETKRNVTWRTIGYYNGKRKGLVEPTELATIDRIRIDRATSEVIRSRTYPGTTLLTVDLPLSADTRTGKDFVVMANS